MIYIVTWCILTFVSDPCPDKLKVDEFGRSASPYISCAVLHGHTEKRCENQRGFDNRDEAFAFYKRAQSDTSSFGFVLGQSLSDVKIDSVVVK